MPIVDKLRESIRKRGGTVNDADTIETALKELNRLDATDHQNDNQGDNTELFS